MAAALSLVEVEEDEEDLFEDLPVACFCAKEGCEIRLTEEMFVLTFVRPYRSEQGVTMVNTYPNGRLIEEPLFYCFSCWEEVKEDAQDACDDVPPMEEHGGLATCDICQSDIMEGETMAVETFGEMHMSQRCPSGQPTMTFDHPDEGSHVCIACIDNMDFEHVRPNFTDSIEVLQDEDYNTCTQGLQRRCWRDRSTCVHCPLK